MLKVIRLAIKNLMRYKRRSLLTGLLIAFGVVAVILFVGLSDSFKRSVVGQITDSFLSHLQVHRKGYLASIDNLPLDRSLPPNAYKKLAGILSQEPGVVVFSPRIKFGSMLSNYAQTTNVRMNGIDPEKEQATVPLLKSRIKDGSAPKHPAQARRSASSRDGGQRHGDQARRHDCLGGQQQGRIGQRHDLQGGRSGGRPYGTGRPRRLYAHKRRGRLAAYERARDKRSGGAGEKLRSAERGCGKLRAVLEPITNKKATHV